MTDTTKPATPEPNREQYFALREAHCNAASEVFWKARFGTNDVGRSIAFDAGFARGFDAAWELRTLHAAPPAATDDRELFEAVAIARGWAYRDEKGLWFHYGRAGHDLWEGWQVGRAQLAAPRVALDVDEIVEAAAAAKAPDTASFTMGAKWAVQRSAPASQAGRDALDAVREANRDVLAQASAMIRDLSDRLEFVCGEAMENAPSKKGRAFADTIDAALAGTPGAPMEQQP